MITLDYFKTHPLRVPKDQSLLSIGTVRATEKASIHTDDIHPTAGAYIHYGGVELADMLTITKPTIPANTLQTMATLWYASCGQVVKQLLFYTWLICSKEMRHGSVAKCEKAFANWEFAHGPGMPEAMELAKAISGSSGSKYLSLLDSHPNVAVGPFMRAVERQFRKGGWGGAYGGPKWADIALELVRYFYGESSAMLAADRCWTLVHNTGPIFNKGFYFHHHDGALMSVLNAQATSSVFTLGTPYEFLTSNDGYAHETSDHFRNFAALALEAIQSVKPDYEFGAGGGVNSDGTKPAATGFGKGKHKKGTTSFGPFAYSMQDREAGQ